MDLFPLYTGVAGPPPAAAAVVTTTGLVDGLLRRQHRHRLWNYAQHYAMSDNSYGTNFGPSTAGAINLISGQTNGVTRSMRNAARCIADGNGGLHLIGDADPAGDVCSSTSGEVFSMSGTEHRRPAERRGRHAGASSKAASI